MNIGRLRIWRTRPGVIGDTAAWCASDGGWLYSHDSLPGLLWQVITEWRHDRHIVG